MHDQEYVRGVQFVLQQGLIKSDRTGVGTVSATGLQLRFDLREGFPLLTLKQVPFRVVAVELQWFLRGETQVKWLQDRKVFIWDDDASKAASRGFHYPEGELGPIYGSQWRAWNGTIDQIANLEHLIKTDPASRRMIVSAWNVEALPKMVLPPCHNMFQVLINAPFMDMVVNMRSGDMGLGIPFNMASYGLLLSLLAHVHGYVPRFLIINVADAHIYQNHLQGMQELIARTSLTTPELHIPNTIKSLQDFQDYDPGQLLSFIQNYKSHGKIFLPLNT
jgi:thymidylate synthase